MEPDDNLIYMILLPLLILLNALFSMSEAAILSLSDSHIRKMADDGHPRAELLVKMIDEPRKFLTVVQTGITLSGLLAASVAAISLTGNITPLLARLPLSLSVARTLTLLLITLALAFLLILLGELVPKRIGLRHSESIALAAARPLYLVSRLAAPFVALLSVSLGGILRLLGIPEDTRRPVTEEAIRMMVDAGGASGSIQEAEKDMINNIFEFDDHNAGDMMTHRTEIVALEAEAPLEEIVATALESGHSRIPVFEDSLDNIVGILYVKDLLGLITEAPDRPFTLSRYMRQPVYVPESNSCKKLLEELRQKKIHMAVVVDEYGGTSGLITMEDLLESIVGNIQDEYDDEDEAISRIAEGLYMVDGLADLEETARFFGFEPEEDDPDDLETIGGYIIHRLGHIPEEQEHPAVTIGGVRFTVYRMEDRRIHRLHAQVLLPGAETAGAKPHRLP